MRCLRNRRDVFFYGFFAVLFIGLTITLAIAFLGDHEADAEIWLVLLAFLWIGISSAAFARTSVRVSADEPSFVVRNSWRRFEVSWSEVAAFERRKVSGPLVVRYGLHVAGRGAAF